MDDAARLGARRMRRTRKLVLGTRGRDYTVEVLHDDSIRVDGQQLRVRAAADGSLQISGEFVQRAWSITLGETRWVFFDGRVFEFSAQRSGRGGRRLGHHHGTLSAPMPATVRHIVVATGDAVRRGDPLIILEAMKMELPIRSPADGVVDAVNCREGELVQPGTPLIQIEEDS